MAAKRFQGEYRRFEKVYKKFCNSAAFTLKEAREAGLSHPQLYELLKEKKVYRLQRGLYSFRAPRSSGKELNFATPYKKFEGRAVISGPTALYHYGLIDEAPLKIWLLVQPTVRTVDKRYRLLRTNKDLNVGVKDEGTYKIVSLERALVDALVFRTKIGERIAVTAILRAVRSKKTTPQKIFQIAKQLDAMPTLNKHWESILAGLIQ